MIPFPLLFCFKLPGINTIRIPIISDYVSAHPRRPMPMRYRAFHGMTICILCMCVMLIGFLIKKATDNFRPPPPIFVGAMLWSCAQSCSSTSILAGDLMKR